ncbi:helix-turn-helix domain-containing protein [Solitalea canadensis]|uniref:DNA-binding domain-containing protein, AraC-type n=1 Tax=Solitalea canadensis (strain ATCC 29591 / DSM 3403 / JCM 21819 / LMG 8368 / NBRC 15130 / NCIMB 12057 / USAM 9D) TaxID=929556 RepID=H8KKZ1_SOLCM|nr:helix-turn-helix domain-containing protein [Solitalea canadensis]AFD08808.1 DNA-binding domain-containing protein, AraC-type [Solitalea canadensis DSM 3403]
MLKTIGIDQIVKMPLANEFKIVEHAPINMPLIDDAHKHDFFMLLLVNSGSGTHTIDFNEYEVKERILFFLAPGQAHQWNLSKNTSGFQVLFSDAFLSKTISLPFFNASSTPVLLLNAEQNDELQQEFRLMIKEFERKEHTSTQILQHRLQIILLLLKRWYVEQFPFHSSGSDVRMINQFEHLVEKYYHQHNEVAFYASQLNVSANYLNAVCKRESFYTAGEFIRNRIMLEAKRMLILTNLDIKEIAFSLSFSDSSYFSRFFKKHTSLSPLEFRDKKGKTPGLL